MNTFEIDTNISNQAVEEYPLDNEEQEVIDYDRSGIYIYIIYYFKIILIII